MRIRDWSSDVCSSDMIFGIDTDGLSIYEFPGQAFVPFHPGNGLRPINQDAVAQGIVWSGALALENPLFSYRIITTSGRQDMTSPFRTNPSLVPNLHQPVTEGQVWYAHDRKST